jgi:hypothetical protein
VAEFGSTQNPNNRNSQIGSFMTKSGNKKWGMNHQVVERFSTANHAKYAKKSWNHGPRETQNTLPPLAVIAK